MAFNWFRSQAPSAAVRAVSHSNSIDEAKARLQLANEATQRRQAQIAELHKQADDLHADQDLVDQQLSALHARL